MPSNEVVMKLQGKGDLLCDVFSAVKGLEARQNRCTERSFNHFPPYKIILASAKWLVHVQRFHNEFSSMFGDFCERANGNRMFEIPFAFGLFQVSGVDNWVKNGVSLKDPFTKGNIQQFMGACLEVLTPWKLLQRTSVFGLVHVKNELCSRLGDEYLHAAMNIYSTFSKQTL